MAFALGGHANGDSWGNILVVYNGGRQPGQIPVPGQWSIVANDQRAGTAPLAVTRDTVQVEACSLVVAHSD